MRTLVAHGPGDFRFAETDNPATAAGAVIALEAAGVCATDRMIWRGDGPWDLAFPFTPGHEILGRVEAVDDLSARRWGVAIGDRVTAEVLVPCGGCGDCARGRTNLCRHGTQLGSGLPGAFAERMVLPSQALVHLVPDALSTAAGVLIEPASCAVHAVRRADLTQDDVVAIAGIGAIGACALGAARAAGAGKILAVVRSEERAQLALLLGADEAVWPEQLREVDVYLDCSGSVESVQTGLRVVRPGGRLVLYGVYREPAVLDLNTLAEHKELDVRGGRLAPAAFPESIRLLADRTIDAELIVNAVHPIEDFRTALEPSIAPRLKAVLVP